MKMKFKTNKSYSKRLKLTKKGKVLSRKSGQNHFNAKESRSKQLAKKKTRSFTLSSKNISRFLPSN
ncbi:TPA: 50S ribosomal protein L35 [Patescibacteria group bacterium]|nr:50S ribosomal protein L35 [Patescibacteria group bacterium]